MIKLKKRWLKFLAGTVVLLLSGCSLPGLGGGLNQESVVVTTGSGTEMQILGYIVEGMIQHYSDLDVEIVGNLGASNVKHQALVGGDADISEVRYTGTSLTGELGMDPITDPELAYETVVEAFDEKFDQKFYPTYGFTNTYVFLVSQELAEEHNLQTVSDLEPIASELVAGFDSAWLERKGDGYDAFVDTYGIEFQQTVPMQIGLVYDALQAGEVDVVLGYSTDGRIASYDLIGLEDDQRLFPPYDASPLATHEILAEHPVLDDILLKLADTISTEQMQQMNYTADNDLVEPRTVAERFLEENNFFEDKEPYLEPSSEEGGIGNE